MSGPSVVVLAALLTAILLVVVGALVWQEARRRPSPAEKAYVIDEAVRFISSRLPDEVRGRLRGGGVKRVIEWEVFYLQGLAQKSRRQPVETVAGGSDASIDYIVDRIAVVNGVTYDRGDVGEVLRLEAEYLMSIGAVGEPVDLAIDQSEEGKDEA
jgi:hypothetical protein